ncbi:uncharacterized protein EI97DRAFT_44593 [Westerdykella ornata]|uniref:Uncharacterized protein n=1 Tax=Westerdykella ornata TaxID=318751 RepID=A0A6A6JJB6_WESOR|nr:uncharacterized protein EI97DRAFT_44593 [Westerdykella ornata]KAF2276577.1 hypothetical protein EI97DRAFT_44593 [Westerdykella ornata]
MKWEPVFNIVHRYLFCRCVLRLGTPSRLEKEMTLLVNAPCPRHNIVGKNLRDYSELAVHPSEDPYFERFGGYNAFWAMLHRCFAPLYERLGGSKAITKTQLLYGYVDLAQMEEDDKEAVRRIADDYLLKTREMLLNKKQESVNDDHLDQFNKSYMGMELRKILNGDWDGIPHGITGQ